MRLRNKVHFRMLLLFAIGILIVLMFATSCTTSKHYSTAYDSGNTYLLLNSDTVYQVVSGGQVSNETLISEYYEALKDK